MDALLAQAVATSPMEWVPAVVQLVTSGGFGALLWFLVWKRMPEIETQQRAEREKWISYLEKRDEKFEALIERCVSCIEESNRNARHSRD